MPTPRDVRFRLEERAAGLLLHPTSLAGPFENGDLGPSAHAFLEFLAACGVRWWQMLPLGPVGPGSSPYSSTSVFAGSALLVSLEALREDGLLDAADEALVAAPASAHADFAAAERRRDGALRRAFDRCEASLSKDEAFTAFTLKHAYWLDDFATFTALKRRHQGAAFFEWPVELKRRNVDALAAARLSEAREISFQKFVQYRFWRDLSALVVRAHALGIGLMGDVPIYVAHDSAEVWAHGNLFQLDASGDPAVVAGVPPDAFSDDGQLWGNPLYDWDHLKATGFGFWVARLEHALRAFDAVRLDHFIGFSRYYAIARGEQSAKKGTFHDVPGYALFETLFRVLGPVELIAEDLGVVTDQVRALRDHFQLPGMNVLQFSFSPGRHAESSRPHRFAERSVVYTGTHDNDTTAGWLGGAPQDASAEVRARYDAERKFALDYLALDGNRPASELAWEVVRAAFRSQARTAIVPIQDLLGLGREARMNRPGIAAGNWAFRVMPEQLSAELSDRVRGLAELYGRVV